MPALDTTANRSGHHLRLLPSPTTIMHPTPSPQPHPTSTSAVRHDLRPVPLATRCMRRQLTFPPLHTIMIADRPLPLIVHHIYLLHFHPPPRLATVMGRPVLLSTATALHKQHRTTYRRVLLGPSCRLHMGCHQVPSSSALVSAAITPGATPYRSKRNIYSGKLTYPPLRRLLQSLTITSPALTRPSTHKSAITTVPWMAVRAAKAVEASSVRMR